MTDRRAHIFDPYAGWYMKGEAGKIPPSLVLLLSGTGLQKHPRLGSRFSPSLLMFRQHAEHTVVAGPSRMRRAALATSGNNYRVVMLYRMYLDSGN
jgi:hypothetical protein